MSVILTASMFASCSTEPSAPAPPIFETGPAVPVLTQTTSGGTITYTKAGDTLSGLSIVVPNGGYSDPRTFTVSYKTVTKASLHEGTHLLSPLITVSNGGGYSDSIMTMTIPVKVPDGDFAMAFAYNDDGKLEALPLVSFDNTSVTFWTKHFEHSKVGSEQGSIAQGKNVINAGTAGESRIVVLSTNMAALLTSNEHTNFLPGRDDWEFANYGSMLTPKGECMGQSLGMIWYYYTQKIAHGAASLWNTYDNNTLFPTPNIWEDDAAAYKFCSMLQEDGDKAFDDDSKAVQTFNKGTPNDRLTLLQFKFAIDETSMPQFVAILSNTTGHAMVVYDITGTTMHVCDPNFPGVLDRTIAFTDPKFSPYNGAEKRTDPPHNYNQIYFLGKTSELNWTSANTRWKEFNRRVIGDGSFPAFIIQVQDNPNDNFAPITDGWQSRSGNPAFRVDYGASSPVVIHDIFLENGTKLAPNFGRWLIPQGTKRLGFYITDSAEDWGGFQWIDIQPSTVNTSIYPLAVGNTWVYKYTLFDQFGTVVSTTIDSDVVQRSLPYNSETAFDLGGGKSYLISRADGIYQWDGVPSHAATQYLKYPAVTGDTCDFGRITFGKKWFFSQDLLVASGSVSTPAGNFSGIQYQDEFRDTTGKAISFFDLVTFLDSVRRYELIPAQVVHSFASGVGPLLTEQREGLNDGTQYLYSRRELVRYHVK